jgi:hypothetical protein
MSQKVEWNPKWLMETLNQFYACVLGMSSTRKSFDIGEVPVAGYNHPLSRLGMNCSKIVNTNNPIQKSIVMCYVLKLISRSAV